MKKLLFGTTALVTAGVLASSAAHAEGGIKLGLGGYMNNYFGVGDADDDGNDFNETTMYSDGEVFFTGETTLDNGLTFGANIQLESYATGDQIDENYGYVEGSFGRLLFGSENTASYLMHYTAPTVGVPVNSGWVTVFIPPPAGAGGFFRSTGGSTNIDIGNDENTITYFTPRMFGFQVGVSYQAALAFSGEGLNNPADDDTAYHNGVAVGVNFVESFGGFDVAVSGGYARADGPDDDITFLVPSSAGTSGRLVTVGRDDMQQVHGGMTLGYAGFTVGGSVAAELDGRITPRMTSIGTGAQFGPAAAAVVAGGNIVTTALGTLGAFTLGSFPSGTNSTEGWSFDVGASYSTGPWSFGITYFHGNIEGNMQNGDPDELDAIAGGVEYAVGPGISTSLSGMYANYDTEEGTDNSGIVGVFGVTFGF